MLYPNLVAECGKGQLCGVSRDALARAANITLELFNAALEGTRTLDSGEAQAIANKINRCRRVDSGITISGEYLLSPTLTEYTAETDSQKDELNEMQKWILELCDLRNFDYEATYHNAHERELNVLIDTETRERAAECVPIITRAMFQPISYAEYRYIRKRMGFVQIILSEYRERQSTPPPRGIDTIPPAANTLETIYYGVYENSSDSEEVYRVFQDMFDLVEKHFGTKSAEYTKFDRRIHAVAHAERLQAFGRGLSHGRNLVKELENV